MADLTPAQELQQLWEGHMKPKLEAQENEIKSFGSASVETKQRIDELNEKIADLETKLNRTATKAQFAGDNPAQDEYDPMQRKAFDTWARKGDDAFRGDNAIERKSMIVANDTTGGFFAPPEFVAEVLKGVVEISPIRQLARVRTTSQRSIKMPKRTGTTTARWIGEAKQRTAGPDLGYGMEEIPNHELTAMVYISFQDLEDAQFNLEQELMAEFSEQFAVAESTAFVTGDGVGKPEGVMTNTDIAEIVNGHATVLQADALITLFYALKTAYAKNGTWAMNRQILKLIRQLKDSNGQYLWAPGFSGNLAGSGPSTILERPYIEVPDMVDAASAASNPILFGDFKKGYIVVDRLDIAVTRDAQTMADEGLVRFIARKRVGGQVLIPEALKKLSMEV